MDTHMASAVVAVVQRHVTTNVELVVLDLAGTTIKDSRHVASAFIAALNGC